MPSEDSRSKSSWRATTLARLAQVLRFPLCELTVIDNAFKNPTLTKLLKLCPSTHYDKVREDRLQIIITVKVEEEKSARKVEVKDEA